MDPILGLAAAAFVVFGMLRWREAAFVALFLAAFEGALRKWVFPQYSELIYLGKALVLVGAYVGFWVHRRSEGRGIIISHPANIALVLFGIFAGIELLNPTLPNLFVGLFGIQAYLVFVPLMYMVPEVFPNAEALRKFWVWYLLLALIPLLLGPLQFQAPTDSILNRYAAEDVPLQDIAVFGASSAARVTGTFSYISGYTTYLTVIALVVLAWLIFGKRARIQWMLYGLLALIAINMFMTGSRGPFLAVGLSVVALPFLSGQISTSRRIRSMFVIGAALVIAVWSANYFFPDAFSGLLDRAQAGDDLTGRLTGLVTNPIWAFNATGLLGFGIGTAHQALPSLLKFGTTSFSLLAAEGEWERIMLELGPIGFMLAVVIRAAVPIQLWMAIRRSKGTPLQPYVIVALLFALISIPETLVYNHTASIYYWFLAGIGLIPAHANEPIREAELRPAPRLREFAHISPIRPIARD